MRIGTPGSSKTVKDSKNKKVRVKKRFVTLINLCVLKQEPTADDWFGGEKIFLTSLDKL